MARIKANGIEFEYDERGPSSGEPVVLVMGYTAQMTRWPESFCDTLADSGYRVVRFDNRDIGLSHQFEDKGLPDIAGIMQKALAGEDASGDAPYMLSDMANDTAEIIKALGLGSAHLIGASMGGMIIQLVAIEHPELVRSIIPVMTTSGAPDLPPSTPEAMAALTEQPKEPTKEFVVPLGLKIRKVIGSLASVQDDDSDILKGIGGDFDRAYRPMGAMRQYAAIMSQPRWHEQLEKVAAPTLVLHGEIDPLLPPECGKDIARRIPNSEYTEIKNWGHDIPNRLIPEITDHILKFLSSVKD